MFPSRYFPDRMFAPRYWPKVGEPGAVDGTSETYCACAVQSYNAGAIRADYFVAGATAGQDFNAGAVRTQGVCC